MATLLPAMVDLSANAVALATRLGSLAQFLEAVHELQSCRYSPSRYFQRHGRKIVTLIEIARKTLKAAGIQIHLFSSCPDSLVPCKAAYVDMLYMLKERRADLDPALEDRVRNLLSPLSSGFQITRKGDPYPSPFPRGSATSEVRRIGQRPTPSTPNFILSTSTAAVPIAAMLPPDAFPVASAAPSGPAERRVTNQPRQLWNIETSPPRYRRSSSTHDDQENAIPQARLSVRPLQRRFGIFCTGKTSMYQYRQPTPRPRAARPLKE
ncbi:hypothetical protein FPV67DRAFT_1503251 [Lyophyllum atratum]|nr:hypothetical protein FPV67DRAFT_1503251 [Lyophyllum atratum]